MGRSRRLARWASPVQPERQWTERQHFGALPRRLRSRCVCVGAEEQGPSRWARFTKPGHHSKARQSTQEGKGHKRANKQMSPPQFVSLSWRLRCHSATPSRALLPTDRVPLLRLSLFMPCPSLRACVYLQSPWRTASAPSKKPRHTKTSRRRRSRHADASDTGRTHAPTLRSTGKARQGKADKQARRGPIMDAPKQEPLTLAHCLPNPDGPSCSTLTLSSSHPRLTACLFACLLA